MVRGSLHPLSEGGRLGLGAPPASRRWRGLTREGLGLGLGLMGVRVNLKGG